MSFLFYVVVLMYCPLCCLYCLSRLRVINFPFDQMMCLKNYVKTSMSNFTFYIINHAAHYAMLNKSDTLPQFFPNNNTQRRNIFPQKSYLSSCKLSSVVPPETLKFSQITPFRRQTIQKLPYCF